MKKGYKTFSLAIAIVGIAALLLFIGTGERTVYAATNVTSTASVSVTIGQITIVDVTPKAMDFGTVYPGTDVANYTDPTTGVTLSAIQIENLGSTNITYIWANVTQPASNPFGTGNPNAYDPANFLVLKRPTDTHYYFIDRVEWNATQPIIYLQLPSNWITYGRIRDGYDEYFWAINGSSQYCNGTGWNQIIIGQVPHNTTQTGTINLVSGKIFVANISATGDPNWGIVNATNISGAIYCVAVSKNCNELRIYKWNPQAPGAAECSSWDYLNSGVLVPGASVIADVQLHVPYGVPYGILPTGTLTIVAESL